MEGGLAYDCSSWILMIDVTANYGTIKDMRLCTFTDMVEWNY